jgi:hypothetical protein
MGLVNELGRAGFCIRRHNGDYCGLSILRIGRYVTISIPPTPPFCPKTPLTVRPHPSFRPRTPDWIFRMPRSWRDKCTKGALDAVVTTKLPKFGTAGGGFGTKSRRGATFTPVFLSPNDFRRLLTAGFYPGRADTMSRGPPSRRDHGIQDIHAALVTP